MGFHVRTDGPKTVLKRRQAMITTDLVDELLRDTNFVDDDNPWQGCSDHLYTLFNTFFEN